MDDLLTTILFKGSILSVLLHRIVDEIHDLPFLKDYSNKVIACAVGMLLCPILAQIGAIPHDWITQMSWAVGLFSGAESGINFVINTIWIGALAGVGAIATDSVMVQPPREWSKAPEKLKSLIKIVEMPVIKQIFQWWIKRKV